MQKVATNLLKGNKVMHMKYKSSASRLHKSDGEGGGLGKKI